MIKKIILMLIMLLGFSACMSKGLVVETTKEIELNEYLELGNYKIKTVEDIAAFLVAFTEIENNNLVTISQVKKSFSWSAEKNGKDTYIVSAQYENTVFKIPVKEDNIKVFTNPADSYVERDGMSYALGSMLPFVVMEVYNNEKYKKYLN
ncbi:hypothetical protein [Fusobacterium polymorphum]|uniref:hypothetical protein n=1 Tax=Fusobacterium nucleatum subsp. polymorphum TaxID=76857 RepID=UPI00300BB2F7